MSRDSTHQAAATGHPTTLPRRLLTSPVWLAVPVLLLARLSLLLSPAGLDGDESILGLMALDVLHGGGLPLFFTGQAYGLSTLEASLGAASFAVLGPGAFALRAAMLPLWALGGLFVVAAAVRLAGARAGWIALALLATCPAWTDWAMKARGGYLTAYAAAHAGIWLLAGRSPGGGGPRGAWLLAGALAGVVALAQPLWLLCLLPVAAARARNARDLPWIGGGGTVAAAMILAARALHDGRQAWAPGLGAGLDPLGGAAALPGRLLDALSGAYLFEAPLPVGWPTRLAAYAWLAATVAAIVVAARGAGPLRPQRRALGAGVALTLLFAWPLGAVFGPRYLLPLPAMVTLLLAVAAASVRGSGARPAAAALAALTLLGGAATVEATGLRPPPPPDHPYYVTAGELRELVSQLDRRDIRHVYSVDPLLQWNVMFESAGRIRARWFAAADRIAGLPGEVDAALARGEPVALLGRRPQAGFVLERLAEQGWPRVPLLPVGDHLFWTGMADPASARALGFQPAGAEIPPR